MRTGAAFPGAGPSVQGAMGQAGQALVRLGAQLGASNPHGRGIALPSWTRAHPWPKATRRGNGSWRWPGKRTVTSSASASGLAIPGEGWSYATFHGSFATCANKAGTGGIGSWLSYAARRDREGGSRSRPRFSSWFRVQIASQANRSKGPIRSRPARIRAVPCRGMTSLFPKD